MNHCLAVCMVRVRMYYILPRCDVVTFVRERWAGGGESLCQSTLRMYDIWLRFATAEALSFRLSSFCSLSCMLSSAIDFHRRW